ncbi:hypothetical protein [Belliella pelovolcani]|uniref:Histidine kinase N-terminal 7TM region domain-containing protein n=1 Tax=Belliella pelovolcani TaxID=529505 RepID=A0A1N7JRD5_9BACT|nr:hypothetical protein [Belliella pelovolcani]SIS51903.1 hypothetical protein SAMN05421761_101212 [Belliella pelovolcani]
MSADFYLISIGLGLFASLIYWGIKNKPQIKSHGIILLILLLVFGMESAGSYTAARRINNTLLYNIGWVYLESLLLILYFYSLEQSHQLKTGIRWMTVLIFLWGILNSFLYQDMTNTFQYFSFLPFALFIIGLTGLFLYRILNLKLYPDKNLVQIPHFWITCSILFFYVEAIVLFGTYQFYPSVVVAHVDIFFSFNRFLAGLMYLTFGLSFFIPLFINKRASQAY